MNNGRLTYAEIFFENKAPYMKLVYEYEDHEGIHELILPKVEFPLDQYSVPDINTESTGSFIYPQYISWIVSKSTLRLFKGTAQVKIEKRESHRNYYDVCYIDAITKPKVYEMTLEEIEQRLGYPVKIVSKEGKHD